jgi:hypothetical protein
MPSAGSSVLLSPNGGRPSEKIDRPAEVIDQPPEGLERLKLVWRFEG